MELSRRFINLRLRGIENVAEDTVEISGGSDSRCELWLSGVIAAIPDSKAIQSWGLHHRM
jgi:hypothetical protein